MKKHSCDVLVIGSGGAGLMAAISAKETHKEAKVILVTKGELGKSGVTALACSDRMAFHVTLPYTEPGGEDAWKHHAEDIYRIGGGVSDEDLAEILARNSRDAFEYLDSLGVPFVRDNGKVAQFVTDGSKYARATYTGPDTANRIEEVLVNKVRGMGIDIIENHVVIDLIVSEENMVIGAIGIDTNIGSQELDIECLTIYETKSVILSTGGAGEAYKVNVFPPGMTGDGYAMAYRAGAELVNMEFIQIGLSSTKTKLACSGTMLRAMPRIINSEGKEFLKNYFPASVTPDEICNILFTKGASWPVSYEEKSHVIDVAVFKEINSGKKVYLDYNANPEGLNRNLAGESPLDRLKRINPEILSWLKGHGVDLANEDKIEIAPAAQHFQGGVKIREFGQTSIKGLYAVGECAGGQHGANRPGGNALLDGQVFGKIAGSNAAEEAVRLSSTKEISEGRVKLTLSHIYGILNNKDGIKANEVRKSIQEILSTYASVVRTSEGLNRGLSELNKLKVNGIKIDGDGMSYCIETINLFDVAHMIIGAARIRTESRGPHLFFNSSDDLKPISRDDEKWQRYIVIKKEDSQMKYEVRTPIATAKGTVPDLRTEQSEVVESGLSPKKSMEKNNIDIEEIINSKALQDFRDAFFKATNMLLVFASSTEEFHKAFYYQNHPCEFCKLIRSAPKGLERCRESDLAGGREAAKIKEPYIYRCRHGLIDIVVPIIVNGKHIGNVFTGQVRLKTKDMATFDEIKGGLERLGMDLAELEKAFNKVEVISEEKLHLAVRLLSVIVHYIVETESKMMLQRQMNEERLRLEKVMPIIQTQFIQDIISRKIKGADEFREKAKFLGIENTPTMFMIVKIDNFEVLTPNRTEGERLLLKENIYNVINQSIQKSEVIMVVPAKGNEVDILLGMDKITSLDNIRLKALEIGENLRSAVEMETSFTVTVGVGRNYENVLNLARSYNDALNAQVYGEFLGSNKVVHIDDVLPINGKKDLYPWEKENELLSQIKVGNKEEARQTLDKFLKEISIKGIISSQGIKNRLGQLLVVMSRAAMEGGADSEEIVTSTVRYQQELLNLTEVNAFQSLIIKAMEDFVDNLIHVRNTRHENIIEQAIRFMKANYNQDISLEKVSQEVSLSPKYFSWLFKNETGTPFVDYLTNIRINEAKNLLSNLKLTISEISQKVGYQDANYFSQVFRKITGSSPTQYREESITHTKL